MAALLLGLFHAVTTAEAAGFHFGRAEALVGWADGDDWSAGLGARLFSDAHQARITFGDPATGPLVREAWLQSRPLGPVIGVVRPGFAAGATGVCFERLGLPLGIELAAEVDHGVRNATGELATTPRARLSLWGQLAPPYRTRIEDRVEAATAPPAF